MQLLTRLSRFPRRGEFPAELAALGIKEFRQVHYKPYRPIYQVRDSVVQVLLIADGRRDMQSLLQRRWLG
jgi:toxin ParE1/3/4